MNATKHIFLLTVIALILASCFKSYEPEIADSDAKKLVVSGLVTNQTGNQKVTITMSTNLFKPKESPVTGCTVTIMDDKGHQFPMTDTAENGNYYGKIDPMYLTIGSSLKVEIITPDGSKIVSDFDKLSSCPELDSVYYIRKDLPTSDVDVFTQGIQFYVDLNGENTDSKYYRWEAVETWEYSAEYPIEWFYDGKKVVHRNPPDYSKDTCWLTLQIPNVFTLSTTELSANKFEKFPLNFVDNKSARLVIGYSLIVNQYSLSETAYTYWNNLRINSTNEGGLYERQPLAAKGNLHNLTHPDQDVLGFFGVSSVSSKRIFIKKVDDLKLEFLSACLIEPLRAWGWADYAFFPVYLLGDSTGWKPFTLTSDCVDCTATGGKNVKPDFWPN